METAVKNTEIEKSQGTEVTFYIPDTESIGRLKDLEPSFSLVLKYKTAKDWDKLKDQPIRAFYMGMRQIPNSKGELITCGLFATETECFLSGQLTLVEAVKNLDSQTPLEITYLGSKKNATTEGETLLFEVKKLA